MNLALDLLTVDPKYQRRGAGHILVRWGTLQADELGLACVVESTDFGLELYRSEGFEKRKEWETVLPAEWENVKGKQRFIWMVREPKM
jgi:predicted N-acetyltransferase YhbS